jgi:hypothetical protein
MSEAKNQVVVSCFGFCTACGMNHALPSEAALVHCHALMTQLRIHRRLDFELPLHESDPLLSTDSMYMDLRGKMMGILLCEDSSGKEVVLRAFSSKHNGKWNAEGWVPPLVDEEKFNATIEAGNVLIHPLTDLAGKTDKGSPEWNLTIAERKLVSQKVLAELYALYEVHNFKNEKRTLADSFNVKKGIPTGTGDCCAPKLLNYAAKNKLKPLSMAEFFWGKETASGHKTEGTFYSSCAEKCQPLLGYMLCGL